MKFNDTLIIATLGILTALPQTATAQSSDEWRFHALLYGYFPEISGKSTFASETGRDGITVSANKIIENLKFTFMGTFEAQRGRWGFFTDVVYMNVGNSKSNTRDLSVGRVELPVGVTADLDLDIKSVVWELAGSYRVSTDPSAPFDILAGARMLSLKQTIGWEFSADLGSNQPSRSGSKEIKGDNWDGIIGVKGRLAFGSNREWFIPYYADIGTGDSDLTWQAVAGLGYAFHWGDIIAGWRYLDYQFKSSSRIDNMSLSGPMVGVAFHW